MALKNKSKYAILGILNIAPSTGYDIKKYCDQVLSGFWNENFGHIYPTLKTMLAEDLIAVANKEENERKVQYKITIKGKRELESWLMEETIQQPVRSEFMLKLLFSSDQPSEQVILMLENYKQLYELNLEKYLEMQKKLENGIQDISKERARFLSIVLRRGVLSSESVIRWCEETVKELGGLD